MGNVWDIFDAPTGAPSRTASMPSNVWDIFDSTPETEEERERKRRAAQGLTPPPVAAPVLSPLEQKRQEMAAAAAFAESQTSPLPPSMQARRDEMLAMGALPQEEVGTNGDTLDAATRQRLYGEGPPEGILGNLKSNVGALAGGTLGLLGQLGPGIRQWGDDLIEAGADKVGMSPEAGRALRRTLDPVSGILEMGGTSNRDIRRQIDEFRGELTPPKEERTYAEMGGLNETGDVDVFGLGKAVTRDALESLPSTLAIMAGGAVPKMAAVVGGLIAGEDSYHSARLAGEGVGSASLGGVVQGLVTGPLESIGSKLMRADDVAIKTMMDAWRATRRATLGEMSTEFAEEIVSLGVEAAQGRGASAADAGNRLLQASTVGGLTGGAVHTVSMGANILGHDYGKLAEGLGQNAQGADIAAGNVWDAAGPAAAGYIAETETLPLRRGIASTRVAALRAQKRQFQDYLSSWQPVQQRMDMEVAAVPQRAAVRAQSILQTLDAVDQILGVAPEPSLGAGGAATIVNPEATSWSVGQGSSPAYPALAGPLSAALAQPAPPASLEEDRQRTLRMAEMRAAAAIKIRQLVPFLSQEQATEIASGALGPEEIQSVLVEEETRQVRARWHRAISKLAASSGSTLSADKAVELADAVTPTTPGPSSRRSGTDPDERIRGLVREYEYRRHPAETGQLDTGEGEYVQVSEDRAKKIADAYEAGVHEPHNPEVAAAYRAFKDETKEQWEFLTSMGVVMEPWLGQGQPYANSDEVAADVRQNNHLYFFLTANGFGEEGQEAPDNPLLEGSGITYEGPNGPVELAYNDLFRAVHDVFGHSAEGFQFGPRGEENAFRKHSRMYSAKARRAMASETRGQNSWVNYGSHLRRPDGSVPKKGDPDFVPLENRPYAAQKTLLLPPQYSMTDEELEAEIGSFSFGPVGSKEPTGPSGRRLFAQLPPGGRAGDNSGGFESLAAASLAIGSAPTPVVRSGIAVAFKDVAGRVYRGKPGENHADLYERHPDIELAEDGDGFVGPSGEYLTRQQASAKLGGAVKGPLHADQLDAVESQREADLIRDIIASTEATGGGTFNLRGGSMAGSGRWVVSGYPSRGEVIAPSELTPERVSQFINANRDVLESGEANVGTWVNKGQVYLDVSILAKDKDHAVSLAQKYKEKAIGHLSPEGFVEVPTASAVVEQVLFQGSTGVAPVLSERVKTRRKFTDKVLLASGHSDANVDQKFAIVDALKAKYKDVLRSADKYMLMWSEILGGPLVPTPPTKAIEYATDPGKIAQLITRLTPGQRKMADEGLALSARLGELYRAGRVTPAHTTKLMMWAILSRGVSPFVQEGAFLEAHRAGVDVFIEDAVAGHFDPIAYGESLPEGQESYGWAASAISPGTPGRGTTQNLNDFGHVFLAKMSKRGKDGLTHLEWIHNAIADPSIPSREIRRAFHKRVKGVGIDNKVLSFAMLLAGRQDVLVIDRVQAKHMYDAEGRYGYDDQGDVKNIYDGKEFTAQGGGLSSLFDGVRGLLTYEIMEEGLAPAVREGYRLAGRDPADGTMGRFHWESWVVMAGMEASHESIHGVINEIEGKSSPYLGVGAREGRYNTFKHGVVYTRNAKGEPIYLAPANGRWYELSPENLAEVMAALKSSRSGILPRGFKVSESKKQPWSSQPGVDQARFERLIAKRGIPARQADVSGRLAPPAPQAGAGQAGRVELPSHLETLTPEARTAWDSVAEVFGATPDVQEAALTVLRQFAEKKLKTNLSVYIATRLSGGGRGEGLSAPEGSRGAVQFLEDGKAIVHALRAPDTTTLMHELFHVMARDLSGADVEVLSKFAKVKPAEFAKSVKAQEKIARAWERYLAEGKTPVPELKPVFAKMRQWFFSVYQDLIYRSRLFKINPKVREVFDGMLTDGTADGDVEVKAGGDTLFQSPRPAPPPQVSSTSNHPFLSYIKDSFTMSADGKTTLARLYNTFRREVVDAQDIARRINARLEKFDPKGYLSGYLTQIVAAGRDKSEVARAPIFTYTHLRNPQTGQPEPTGKSLQEIIGGYDAETIQDLEGYMAAQSQIETDEHAQDQAATYRAEMDKFRKVQREILKAQKDGDWELVKYLKASQDVRPTRANLLKTAKRNLAANPTSEDAAALARSAKATLEAHSYLAALKKKWGPRIAELDAIAEEVRAWSIRANLDVLVAAGRITQETADKIVYSQQKYAPFLRLLDDLDADLEPHVRMASDGMKRRTGDISEGIARPLVSFVMKAQAVQRWAAAQYVDNALGELADKYPDVVTEIRPKGKKSPVNTFDQSRQIRRWVNGEEFIYDVDAEIVRAFHDLNPALQSWFFKFLGKFASIRRLGATSGLGFITRNPGKDQPGAAINSAWGYVPVYHWAQGIIGMAGTMSPRIAALAPELTKYAKEYFISGAGLADQLSVDMKEADATLQSMMSAEGVSGHLKKARDFFRRQGVLAPLQMLGRTFELGTRVGSYVNARRGPDAIDRAIHGVGNAIGGKVGKVITGSARPLRQANVLEAASESRGSGLDFAQMGHSGRMWNMVEAFANPQLQDVEKVRSNFQKNWIRTSVKAFAYITVPTILNYLLRRDDEDYRKLHEWDRAMFYHPYKLEDGGYLRFPRPVGVMNLVFGYGIHKLLEYGDGLDPEAMGVFLNAAVDQTPLTYGANPIDLLVPTAGEPVMELFANREAFTDRPIENEWQRREGIDRRILGQETAGPFAGAMAENVMGGHLSAPQIEHLITGHGATLGKYALEYALNPATSALTGRPPESTGFTEDPNPAMRFLGWKSVRPYGFGSKPVADLYALVQRAEAGRNTIRQLEEQSGNEDRIRKMRGLYPEAAFYDDLMDIKKGINEQRQTLRDIQADMAAGRISGSQGAREIEEINQWVTQEAVSTTEWIAAELRAKGK